MKEAVVLFSGGVDSTYVVMKAAPLYDRLFLITYRVPGMCNVTFSDRSVRQLINLFGRKIRHEIIDIRDYVYTIRGNVAGALRDNYRYGFYCSWCLGCRVGMHLSTIKFCKEHSVPLVLDGSSAYDPESLPQHKEILDLINETYRENGFQLTSPYYYEDGITFSSNRLLCFLRKIRFYKDATTFRYRYLKQHGIDLGRGFISQYRSTQPSCATSIFFNGLKPFFALFRKESKQGYLAYTREKMQYWKKMI